MNTGGTAVVEGTVLVKRVPDLTSDCTAASTKDLAWSRPEKQQHLMNYKINIQKFTACNTMIFFSEYKPIDPFPSLTQAHKMMKVSDSAQFVKKIILKYRE